MNFLTHFFTHILFQCNPYRPVDDEKEDVDTESNFSRFTKRAAREERSSVPIYKSGTDLEQLHILTSHVFDPVMMKPIPENSSEPDATMEEPGTETGPATPVQNVPPAAPKNILDVVREELENDQLFFTDKERQNQKKETELEAVTAEKKWREKLRQKPTKPKVKTAAAAAAKAYLSLEAEVSNDDESDDFDDDEEFAEEDLFVENHDINHQSDQRVSSNAAEEEEEEEEGPSFSALLQLLEAQDQHETEAESEADDCILEGQFSEKHQFDVVNIFTESYFQKGREEFLQKYEDLTHQILKLEMVVNELEKVCNTTEHQKICALGASTNLWKHNIENQFCYLDNNDKEVVIPIEIEEDVKRLELAKKKLAEARKALKNFDDPSKMQFPKASFEGQVNDRSILPTFDFQKNGKVTYVPSVDASVPSTSWLNKEQEDVISNAQNDHLQDSLTQKYAQCPPNSDYGKDAFGRCSEHSDFLGPVEGYKKGKAIKEFLGFILRPCFRGYTFLGKINFSYLFSLCNPCFKLTSPLFIFKHTSLRGSMPLF